MRAIAAAGAPAMKPISPRITTTCQVEVANPSRSRPVAPPSDARTSIGFRPKRSPRPPPKGPPAHDPPPPPRGAPPPPPRARARRPTRSRGGGRGGGGGGKKKKKGVRKNPKTTE